MPIGFMYMNFQKYPELNFTREYIYDSEILALRLAPFVNDCLHTALAAFGSKSVVRKKIECVAAFHQQSD